MITYFEDKNNKSKKKYRKYKRIITILKSFNTFLIIATTSSSITLSLIGIRLIAIPKSTATACGLSTVNKVLYEINTNKNNKNKEQYEKYKQTIKSFDKLYRKSLKYNVIDENQYESMCDIFTEHVDETKTEPFL